MGGPYKPPLGVCAVYSETTVYIVNLKTFPIALMRTNGPYRLYINCQRDMVSRSGFNLIESGQSSWLGTPISMSSWLRKRECCETGWVLPKKAAPEMAQ